MKQNLSSQVKSTTEGGLEMMGHGDYDGIRDQVIAGLPEVLSEQNRAIDKVKREYEAKNFFRLPENFCWSRAFLKQLYLSE